MAAVRTVRRDFHFDQIYATSRCAIKADDDGVSSKSSEEYCQASLRSRSCYPISLRVRCRPNSYEVGQG